MAAAVAIRAALPDDGAALMQLVTEGVGGAVYRELPLYFVRLAVSGRSDESRAVVAVRGSAIVGCALFGSVAGTLGTGRIHFVTVAQAERRLGIATRLCAAAIADLAAHGARSVMVELPDEADVTAGRDLLMRCGFAEVARVADYYRDGVALIVLSRVVSPPD